MFPHEADDKQGIVRRAFLFVAFVAFFALSFVSCRRAESYWCDPTPIVAKKGDTLWSLAHSACDGNVANAVDDAYSRYGDLSTGELVELPRGS